MKQSLIIALAVLVMGCGIFAVAQSDLLTADYSTAGWKKAYRSNEDAYVGERKRIGYGIRTWSYARDSNTTSTAGYDLGIDIPSNAIVMQVIVDLIDPVLPVDACTNSISVESTGDLYAASTNLSIAAGIQAGVPVDTAATAFKANGSSTAVKLYTTGTAATSGVFKVFIKYYQSQ